MGRYVLKRLGLTAITLVLVSFAVFGAAELLPGDVGRAILGPFASRQQVEQLNHELGADQPLVKRYVTWAGDFVRGDWGTSPIQRVEVRPLVLERMKNSLLLGAFALLLIVPISVLLGVIAALKYGKTLDRVISIAGLSFVALPEFVVGVVVIVVFSVQLGWFPVSSQVPDPNPVDVVRQFMLPSIPLMFVLFGYISRMARAGTIEALRSNYTRTAVLKGMPRRHVIVRHVLRNSLLPTITVVSVQVGYLVGGLVVIETLFSYPGIGQLILNAAVGHDLPTLEAAVLMIAVLYMVANFVADVLYALLNPRLRLAT
ncbi:MAG: peptide/nickel transport system permease protein [Gaiellales bacterium]|jgi:peptide/nickel transport system permease protein|nr:peptide/nickel transport system permease protein [Gaiellales bacterium]